MIKLTVKFYRWLAYWLDSLADFLEGDPKLFMVIAIGGFIKGFIFFFLLTYLINW